MFGKILVAGWIVFGALILFLACLRKLLGSIPHVYLLKPFLLILMLASFVYGILWLRRQGMNRVRLR
jgi:hypothetical protein